MVSAPRGHLGPKETDTLHLQHMASNFALGPDIQAADAVTERKGRKRAWEVSRSRPGDDIPLARTQL